MENWLRQNSDQAIDHAGKQEKHPVFGRGLKYQIKKELKKKQKELDENVKKEMAGKKTLGKSQAPALPRGNAASNEQNNQKFKDGTQAMLECFQEEELGQGFVITDTDLYLQQRRITAINAKLKERGEQAMGIQNPTIRSISISAFLRCLYASIESAPHADYHQKAIENI